MRRAETDPNPPVNKVQPPTQMKLLPTSYQRVHAILMLLREHYQDAPRQSDAQREAIQFIRAFPGCWFRIPDLRQLEEVLKRDQVVGAWMHDRTKERRQALSQLHDMPVRIFRQHELRMINRQQREAERAKTRKGK